MFDQVSYKYKFYVLLIVALLLGIASYKRSFRYTLSAKKENRILSEKQGFVKANLGDIDQLASRSNYLDKLIGKDRVPSEVIQQRILEFIPSFKNVKVSKLAETHYAIDGGFKVNSYEVVLSGSYNSIADIIYQFEKNFSLAKIVAMEYYKKKNYKTKKEQLFVKLIFQNYEKN